MTTTDTTKQQKWTEIGRKFQSKVHCTPDQPNQSLTKVHQIFFIEIFTCQRLGEFKM